MKEGSDQGREERMAKGMTTDGEEARMAMFAEQADIQEEVGYRVKKYSTG